MSFQYKRSMLVNGFNLVNVSVNWIHILKSPFSLSLHLSKTVCKSKNNIKLCGFSTFSKFQRSQFSFRNPGVDILRKKPKKAQRGKNSAQAKFQELPQLSDFTP